jgi:PTH2 family peptidyl-tRNA hydrolase
MNIKQVIVMRHDLGMRRGKQMAQAAHASMEFLRWRICQAPDSYSSIEKVQMAWLASPDHAKICCRVDSEAALLAIHEAALAANLESHVVTDFGLTEFKGQHTRTCLAIGPDLAEKIDAVTRHLSLL